MTTSKKTPRILLVCYANSAHALPWLSLLDGSGFDARVFSTPLREEETNMKAWNSPTYIVVKPEKGKHPAQNIHSLLPGRPFRAASNFLDHKFSLTKRWLKWVIQTWQPDILHSMPLDVGGKLIAQVWEELPRSLHPKWVASSWGSDIYLGVDDPEKSANIRYILEHCDGFMADCNRDLQLAVRHGLDEKKLAFDHPMPGNGGLDLEYFQDLRAKAKTRDVILLPKAFERDHANRVLPALEALNIIVADIQIYEIHLVMASLAVRAWLRQMPQAFQDRCRVHDALPQRELFELYGRARVVLSPSLSEGTPNIMLEAMAAGALPVMSPIDSIQEWITDGENGLLAHALYPDKIAAALQRALTDASLFERAQRLNWEIVSQRANRQIARKQVVAYYQSLIG
jgi:glycosyltransferase involved in cell wall biosynthesis